MRGAKMGASSDKNRSTGTKKKTRGSVRNLDRLEAFASGGGKGEADWGACDPTRIQAVVVGITELGGAVTFGTSRDMGSHSLTLMLDGKRSTLWFNGNADLDVALFEVAETLDAIE